MYTEICNEMGEEERDREIKKKKRKREKIFRSESSISSLVYYSTQVYKDISQINLILYNKQH